MEDARVVTVCDICFAVDSHPKHVLWIDPAAGIGVPSIEELSRIPDGTPAVAIAQLMDPATLIRHLNCCAERGCESCTAQLAVADGAEGDELLAHILENPDAHAAAVNPEV